MIFQIEGIQGFNNLNQILNHDGVNSIFIGPYDLSQSLGSPGDIWNTAIVDKMKKIIKDCNDQSISVGVFTDTIDGLKFWSDLNVDFIEYGSDMMIISEALTKLKVIIASQSYHPVAHRVFWMDFIWFSIPKSPFCYSYMVSPFQGYL